MSPSRMAAALAAGLLASPVLAGEHTGYHFLEAPPDALQPCRAGMLLNLPPSWQVGDGAVVLLTTAPRHDAARDALVSTLLFEEHAAVVELMPVRCGAAQDGVIAGAVDALHAMTRTIGAGMVVAIGYGPGARTMLDVLGAPAAGLLHAGGPRYAAAAAIADGRPAFALGEPLPGREAAAPRLAALCRALAAVLGGMGAEPDRAGHASASEACHDAVAGGVSPAAHPVPAALAR